MKTGRTLCIFAGILALSLALPLSGAFAGTTGKIVGQVTDAQGRSLPGANVVIEGTKLGAVTDQDGFYIILSVDPGVYSLTASLVGYTRVTKRDVRVIVDHTTTVDFKLREEAIQAAEVVVTAEHLPVEPDKTSSRYVTSADDIKRAPIIKTTGEFISLQPGVDMAGTFSVRGSDISLGTATRTYGTDSYVPNDVYVMVDGVRIANQDGHSAFLFTGVNKSAVQQISVETGVTPAEYGDAQAGTINIVTQEGAQRFHGWTEFNYQPAGQKHWGANVYDAPQHRDHMKWKDQAWLTEVDPLTGRVVHQRADYTKWAGFTVESTLSGPLGPNTSFLASLKHERRATQFPSAESHGFYNDRGQYIDAPNNIQGSASATWKPSGSTKLKAGLILQRYKAWNAYNPEGEIAEGLIRGLGANGQNVFLPDKWAASGRYLNQEDIEYLTFTHTLSPKMFYEVRIAHSRTLQDTLGTPRVTLDPRRDRDGWFILDRQVASWVKSDRERWSLKADLSSQITKGHFVKTGFEVMRYNAYYTYWAARSKANNLFTFYSGGDKPYEMGHPATPIRGAFYVQDKMELEGLIVNAGVRLDFNVHTHKEPLKSGFIWAPMWRLYTTQHYLYGEGTGGPGTKATSDLVKTPPPQFAISPRLGISHPITDRMAMHFSLGRFYQWPDLYDIYTKTYRNYGRIGLDGDPTWRDVNGNGKKDPAEEYNVMEPLYGGFGGDPWVHPDETLTFEVGVDWNFINDYTASLTTFYRSETNQIQHNSTYWLGPKGGQFYTQGLTNAGGGLSKGIEVAVGKRLSNHFSFRVAWTSQWTAWGYMGLTQWGQAAYPDSNFVASGQFWYNFSPNPDGSETAVALTPEEVKDLGRQAQATIRNFDRSYKDNSLIYWGKIPELKDKAIYSRYTSLGGASYGPFVVGEKVGGILGQANVQFIVVTPSDIRFGPRGLGWLVSDLNANLLWKMRTGSFFNWTPPEKRQRRDRGPMATVVDLSVEKELNAKGRVRPSFFIEVRNLFNQKDDTDRGVDYMRWGLQTPRPYDPNYLNYGDPGDRNYANAPRQTNLGIRVAF